MIGCLLRCMGPLMHVKFIDGVAVTTNDKQFAQAGNPRSCVPAIRLGGLKCEL